MCSYLLICFSKSPRRFFFISFFFFPVYFTAMHLFGLNWQLQELDNQQAFENGGTGKTGTTQSSIVTALAADGEKTENWLAPVHIITVYSLAATLFLQSFFFFFNSRFDEKWLTFFVWTILHVISSPDSREGAYIWWNQSCKFTVVRIEKKKMEGELNCSTTTWQPFWGEFMFASVSDLAIVHNVI